MQSDVLHILPVNDLRDHEESENCWCRPRYEDGVIIHNAMDQRELYETGERKPAQQEGTRDET